MKRSTFFIAIFCLALAANAQYTNVIVGDGSEVSIMIDPNNPERLVAGANISYVFHSTDTGQTWTQNTLTSSMSVWGDPAIIIDPDGVFYYFHLVGSIDRVVCQKSLDGGATWNDGTFTGYNPPDDEDKEWAIVDWTNNPSRGTIYLTWADLDAYSSSNPFDSARIMISKSTDKAATWSTPVRLSKTAGNCGFGSIKGAVPSIGPNGEVYVAWCGNGVSFQKSTDGGNTWLPQDITVDFQPSWYFTIPGMTWGNGFPSIACDLSGGPCNGNIYISWADTRNGANNSDVFLARSTDGGSTWNTVKINDDITTNHNFHPWVTVDQVTGYVYVVFYDRRNYTADSGTDVYLAYSTDGGAFWTNEKISNTSFLGSPWDYNNVVAYNKIIRPIWAQSSVVYTALINHDDLPVGYDTKALPPGAQLYPNYPNPFYDHTNLKFSLPQNAKVVLKLYNEMGDEVATLLNGQKFTKGYHELTFYASRYNLRSGLYSLRLVTNGQQHSIRVMVER